MDRFDTLRVFIAVATEGSFVAASRALGLSAPAVTRAIARLEQNLGVQLLHRTTRAVRLSDAGSRYLADAQAVLQQLEAADAAVTGSFGTPQGTLKLTAPVLFGQRYVIPIVAEYLALYPAVDVRCLLLDRVTNLLEDNMDVAVRLGDLADSGMYSITVGTIRKVTCAAPGYLQQHGTPATPEELASHRIVHATAVEHSTTWRYGSDRVRVTPCLQCNQNGAAVNAAVAGMGIARLMSYQIADALAANSLELLLEPYEPAPIPVNLVYLEGRKASAGIRSFLNLAAERLSSELNRT